MNNLNDKLNKRLLRLAIKSYKKNEVPVSAAIVYKNKIIASASNNRQKKYDVTGHAEILAIRKAERKIKDWRLDDCTLYVTLKPCHMCDAIIKESRIKKVYYWLNCNKKNTDNSAVDYQQTKPNEKYEELFKKFFKNMR